MKQYNNQPTEIILREITADRVRQICNLSDTLSSWQRKMVAVNAVSIAQAYFCDKAWFRAIYAGEEPIGFVMLHTGGMGTHSERQSASVSNI
ncbi:MAG: hypothetical protein ACQESO_04005 [Bacillota bacterium]